MKIRNLVLLSAVLLFACDRSYTPKPAGYIKVHYPEKNYRMFDGADPYRFEYPVYAFVIPNF